jgi:rare lipoprotein A (peptidoglycan hydrolase)
LALCAALVVAPLLLLATPGRATGVARATPAARAPHASGTRHHARALLTAVSIDPGWSLPAAAVAQYESTTTTTTTTLPRPVVVPVVNHVAPTTTTTTRPPAPAAAPAPSHYESGTASWYSAPAGTCASPDLPFGTVVTVTDQATGGSVRCTIADREAQNPGRVIDMSEQTFSQLADPSVGLIQVTVSW